MDIEKTLANLRGRGFKAICFKTAGEAGDYIAASITGATVGIGGSVTVTEMGLYDKLAENNQVFWHHTTPGPETYEKAATADVYISGVNAVAETGELVNIDGRGNRVSSTLYGHKRLFLVTGTNKITPDLESAVFRARNVAAPKNAARLKRDTPCAVKADRCYDCRSPQRICNSLVIMMAPMLCFEETEVILIDQELGL